MRRFQKRVAAGSASDGVAVAVAVAFHVHLPSQALPDRGSGGKKTTPEKTTIDKSSLGNSDLGPFLLKMARDTIASGGSPSKALDFAIRAARSFERCSGSEPSLDLAMCLHVVAAFHCSLGRFEEAVPVLERAIRDPDLEKGSDHALAMFSG